MKDIFIIINMCISMFTILPTVPYKWDENRRREMLLFLPFIGLIIGGLWFIFYYFMSKIKIHNFYYIFVFFISIFPMVLSGFIHVDGFMDIIDAICSCRNIDKRKKILKDPNVGSFAVIFFVIFVILNYLSMFSIITNHHYLYFLILIFIPFYSRLMSSISMNIFNKIEISEYNNIYIINKFEYMYYIFLFIVFFIIISFINIKFIFIIFIEIICHIFCMLICNKNLQGVNGDSSGFAIFVSESIAILSMSIIFNL